MKMMNRIAAAGAMLIAAGAASAATPTYSKDVAPILNANCVTCHRPGDIAPMSLTSYDEVRPWVKAILKNVSEGVMPPWYADKGYGPWKNDRSMEQAKIDTVVRWAKAGAPEGKKSDLPPLPKFAEGEWKLGTPDMVVTFNEIKLPAQGDDQFYNLVGPTNFDQDQWVTALEIIPGDHKVVHHVILWDGAQGNQTGWIGAWAAGAGPVVFPEGTGRLLKKGAPIIGDMHYHLYGEATSDKTRVGLHFAKGNKVNKELVNLWVMNADFKIPAGDPNYETQSTFTFGQDSHILTLTPHMHYRGKDFQYTLTTPDGKKQDLLKVSKYSFAWQTGYEFEKPIVAPKGSKIDCIAHFDNSTNNPNNPDPTKDISFGPQSYDEMMIGFVDYIVDEGMSPKKDTTVNPVLAKMDELAAAHPGEVFKVMIQQGPGGMEASALHAPKTGDGGWYVKIGAIVGKAPVTEIVWSGTSFAGTVRIPGQAAAPIEGTIAGDTITITMTQGTVKQQITGTLVK